jgi:hypothetical protein
MPFLRSLLVTLAAFLGVLLAASTPPTATANPFQKFVGEWALKDDAWSHNWGGGDEQIKILKHHTLCQALNTPNSLLTVVDGPPPHGHIFWTYNRSTGEVLHLSSFSEARTGTGQGTVNERGDVSLKLSFSDEAPGTYRLYTYTWITDDEYELKSVQYDRADKPTGLFYGGNFVRMK